MSDTITIDFSSLRQAVKKCLLPEDVMNRILQLTVAKTGRWARNNLVGQLGKNIHLSSKVIKGRMAFTIKKKGSGSAHLWLGLNPISLSRFNPVQTASGVTTDVNQVDDGFIWDGKVFKRRGSARLPIDKQLFEIKEKADPIFDSVVKKVQLQLTDNFEKSYLEVLKKS